MMISIVFIFVGGLQLFNPIKALSNGQSVKLINVLSHSEPKFWTKKQKSPKFTVYPKGI